MNLQITLVGLGIIVVVAIYLLSRWQNPKGKSRELRPNSDSFQEPSFGRDAPGFDRDIAADSEEFVEQQDTQNPEQPDSEFTINQQDDIPVLETRVDSGFAEEQGDEQSAQELSSPDSISTVDSDPMPTAGGAESLKIEGEGEGEDSEEAIDSDIPELLEQMESGESAINRSEESGDASKNSVKVAANETPSLSPYLRPLNRIRDTIQKKLDTVKSERENPHHDDSNQSVAESEAGSEIPVGQHGHSDASESIPTESVKFDDIPALEAAPEIYLEGHKDPSLDILLSPPTPGKTTKPGKLSTTDVLNVESPPATDRDKLSFQPAEGFEKLSQIDYYVKLNGDRDVSRESVLAIYRESAGGISRAHSIYGLLLPEKVWRNLEDEPEESRFGDIVITMQLVDQLGAVSEQEMTRFSTLVMNLSESTGRGFTFMAPVENAHQQALTIDRFRIKFDSIFVVNIRPIEDEMFEGIAIERCASQIGLIADQNNFYVRNKPVGKQQKVCLYSLANMSDSGEFDLENMRAVRTRGVTFFTRPAVNISPGAVFAEMVDAAKAFASRIKGEVIAPGHDNLSMDDVEVIRKSIEKVAKEMEDCGISPGSEVARRLF